MRGPELWGGAGMALADGAPFEAPTFAGGIGIRPAGGGAAFRPACAEAGAVVAAGTALGCEAFMGIGIGRIGGVTAVPGIGADAGTAGP